MKIKHNLASNFLGGIWNAAITLLVTPFQVSLLGVASFGLISSIAVIQIIVGALDFGLAAVVSRELAMQGKANNNPQKLLRSVITVYWFFGALILITFICLAPLISKIFFESKSLTHEYTVLCLRLIGFYIALRWPITLYVGVLSGLHKFDTLNSIRSSFLTLRLLFGLLLLLFFPSLLVLIYWYIFVAVLELFFSIYFSHKYLPFVVSSGPILDTKVLLKTWHFSALMYGISILSVILTQLDKIFISGMLGLESLGYYSIVYSLAVGLSLVQTSINGVAIPALTSAFGVGDKDLLERRYNKFSQVMAFTVIPCAMGMFFFSEPLLAVWVGANLAGMTHDTLMVLAAGFICSSIFSNVYALSIACGKPGLFFKANIIGVIIYIPVLIFSLNRFGYIGGAYAWLFLNLYYLIFFLPIAHRQLIIGSTRVWINKNIMPFLLIATTSFYFGSVLYKWLQNEVGLIISLCFSVFIYLPAAYLSLNISLRNELKFFSAK
jgi:O-antigen/teichoic acid export membrane protein